MSSDKQAQSSVVQEIKDAVDDDLLEKAGEAGVEVDTIARQKLHQHSDADFGVGTLVRFVTSEITRQIEAKEGDELRGIVMGSRDRYGKNWPRRHSLLRSNEDHIEVSTWGGELAGPSGEDISIPTGGAIVTFRCEYDSEYESYQGKGIESVTQLSDSELVDELLEVAKSPDELTSSDEYSVVAVKGEIAFINPQTIFEDGEPGPDGPVLMSDENGHNRPHFEVALEGVGDTRLRGHLERVKHANPYLNVDDLVPLVETAAAEYPDDPDKQAGFLQDGLRGVEVLMVGNLSNYHTSRDRDGDPVNYVDVGITALLSTDIGADATASVESEAQPEPGDGTDGGADGGADDGAEATGKEDTDISDVRADIEQYAKLVGEEPVDLTVEDVESAMDLDVPTVVVREALRGFGDGTEDGVGEPDVDPQEAHQTDPVEALKHNGVYHCPGDGDGDDCLFQAGSSAELLAHVQQNHDPDVAPDELAGWVEAQLGV